MSSSQQRPSTQIEGMAQLEKDQQEQQQTNNPHNDDNMTEAEKSMREEELSFYSNSENEYGDDNIWGLLSGVGGNIYEWYVTDCVSHTQFMITYYASLYQPCLAHPIHQN